MKKRNEHIIESFKLIEGNQLTLSQNFYITLYKDLNISHSHMTIKNKHEMFSKFIQLMKLSSLHGFNPSAQFKLLANRLLKHSIEDHDYLTVGNALLKSFVMTFGSQWSYKFEAEWIKIIEPFINMLIEENQTKINSMTALARRKADQRKKI